MTIFSVICLIIIFVPWAYLMLQLLGSLRVPVLGDFQKETPTHSFCIAIAAHNEEAVIANTVQRLLALDYPADLYTIRIVADHCSDQTAELGRRAGAIVYDRYEGPRNGKAAALSWLFQHILNDEQCQAVVVFDADTRVDKEFLRIMDHRLKKGEKIIQGQHVISNPEDGWFPSLMWTTFLIDNRFQNLGRANLGWSAKNMGDSICFRAETLRQVGWGDGLADDYQLRQKFLLKEIKIAYEPRAKGFGEAALTLAQARAQRLRWIRGVYDANQQYASQLLQKGIQTWDLALLDGALQAYLPSYSFLTAGAGFLFALNLVGYQLLGLVMPAFFLGIWLSLLLTLFLYPIAGLALEKAPKKAYLIMLTAPVFMVWRIWLGIIGRIAKENITWVRTVHKG